MNLPSLITEKTLLNLLVRFALNGIVLYIIVGRIYYAFSKKENYLFFFVLLGVMIFLVCAILGSQEVHIGFALGLFALFTIIRFRTVPFSVKDITYMILIIGISIVNSQAYVDPPILGAVIINITIIGITWFLEKLLEKKGIEKLDVTFNKIELLKPENRKVLLKELSILTGQNIERVNIVKIDFERGRSDLVVYFKETRLRYEYQPAEEQENVSVKDDLMNEVEKTAERNLS